VAGRLPATAIDDRTLITRNVGLPAAPVQGETVVLDIARGRYYGLDEIGSDIWRRLESPRTFAELVEALAADYDAERATIAEDVRRLLAVMAEHEVVTLG
jgi:hypothetical protein